jgi:hypothetical protein
LIQSAEVRDDHAHSNRWLLRAREHACEFKMN